MEAYTNYYFDTIHWELDIYTDNIIGDKDLLPVFIEGLNALVPNERATQPSLH